MSGLLLDTNALVFWANGTLGSAGRAALEAAEQTGETLYVSAVSAWELADNARPGRSLALQLLPTPEAWYQRLFSGGLQEVGLTSPIAFASARLPRLHADPIDRFIIATARAMAIPVVTRDRKIHAYAQQGFLGVIPC